MKKRLITIWWRRWKPFYLIVFPFVSIMFLFLLLICLLFDWIDVFIATVFISLVSLFVLPFFTSVLDGCD